MNAVTSRRRVYAVALWSALGVLAWTLLVAIFGGGAAHADDEARDQPGPAAPQSLQQEKNASPVQQAASAPAHAPTANTEQARPSASARPVDEHEETRTTALHAPATQETAPAQAGDSTAEPVGHVQPLNPRKASEKAATQLLPPAAPPEQGAQEHHHSERAVNKHDPHDRSRLDSDRSDVAPADAHAMPTHAHAVPAHTQDTPPRGSALDTSWNHVVAEHPAGVTATAAPGSLAKRTAPAPSDQNSVTELDGHPASDAPSTLAGSYTVPFATAARLTNILETPQGTIVRAAAATESVLPSAPVFATDVSPD